MKSLRFDYLILDVVKAPLHVVSVSYTHANDVMGPGDRGDEGVWAAGHVFRYSVAIG